MAIDMVPIITGLSAGATIGTGWLIRELRHRRNNNKNSNKNNNSQTKEEVDCLERDIIIMKGDIVEIKTTQKLFMQFTRTQFNLLFRILNGKK